MASDTNDTNITSSVSPDINKSNPTEIKSYTNSTSDVNPSSIIVHVESKSSVSPPAVRFELIGTTDDKSYEIYKSITNIHERMSKYDIKLTCWSNIKSKWEPYHCPLKIKPSLSFYNTITLAPNSNFTIPIKVATQLQ